MSGVIIVHKPSGMSSHDVVDALRRITGIRRIGHAGTLDPLAEGVLILLIGREATKMQSQYLGAEKEYVATVFLGATSPTDDAEGQITETAPLKNPKPNTEQIQKVLAGFVGEILQTPPVYSAIHIKGRRAYKAAREGNPIIPEPRRVVIKDIELLAYQWPLLKIRVVCSKGTYIRSLAKDIGEKLSCGAYLKHLLRTRSGGFSIDHAVPLSTLKSDSWEKHLVKTEINP